MTKERIAKFMASTGLCSRRDAEKLILDGKISVNGEILKTPAFLVDENDVILNDGKPLNEKPKPRLWVYYKPRGLVVSHKDPEGRATVFQNLPSFMPRVISIGRLDLDSEGLLLLTNDGGLSRHLEAPSTGWKRKYKVRIFGKPTQETLDTLLKGITIEGVHYKSIEAVLERQQGSNAWILVTLTEGKNREIRKVMEYFGWTVNRLLRLSFGPFELKDMNPGDTTEIPPRVLKNQIGSFFSK